MKYSTTDFLKAATTTAEHFGFKTVDRLRKDPTCKTCPAPLSHTFVDDDLCNDTHRGVRTGGIVSFCNEKLYALKQPVLLYSLETDDRTSETSLTLNVFNVQKSIAEALLIQASRALLSELGHEDHLVRINSLGDTESSTRYVRELTTYLRKRLDLMPDQARELMKEHPLLALTNLVQSGHELAYKSPNPLEFLSDQSRKHFREIIEYLDMSEASYEIDPKMIGHHELYSDALFSIERTDISPESNPADPVITVRGGRFDEYVYRKTRERIPAAGAVIALRNQKPVNRLPRTALAPSSIYVVQLGFGPKMRSLMIIDELRKAGISVEHDLASDSLSAQLRNAEARGMRYTIIIGQKEYVERSVILRDLLERSQEQVPIDQMVKILKRQNATTRA